jgi:Transposase IS66 family
VPRVERRRKWTVEEKAALLAEVEAVKRRGSLTRFVTDARLEIDNNIAENAMRAIAKRESLCRADPIWTQAPEN